METFTTIFLCYHIYNTWHLVFLNKYVVWDPNVLWFHPSDDFYHPSLFAGPILEHTVLLIETNICYWKVDFIKFWPAIRMMPSRRKFKRKVTQNYYHFSKEGMKFLHIYKLVSKCISMKNGKFGRKYFSVTKLRYIRTVKKIRYFFTMRSWKIRKMLVFKLLTNY